MLDRYPSRRTSDDPRQGRSGIDSGPIIVRTRLQAPAHAADVVMRSRLLAQLEAGTGRRLTLVSAPAGFGKSTLLSGWREASQDRRVAWLSIDAADDDPAVLWAHVIESLRDSIPGFGGRARSVHGPAGADLYEVVLPALVNELGATGPCAVVLDDFHRISSESSRRSVLWLVEHAPSTLQLVVSTRADPAFPLGALRAHGELVEIRAADLRFTADEAQALLNDKLGMGLESDDVAVLVERTEGWAAGLYLAALTLRGADNRHALVRSFSGSSSHVVDFLSTEVLSSHDPGMQAFMMQSSVLERLSGPLCDAVLGRQGSATVLEALARSNMFLVPLDDRREWYRFHQLFAQLLRVELERRWPGRAAILHARAADWHLEAGSDEGAIEHYVAAGRFERAAAVIAAGWSRYLEAPGPESVLAWLRRLPNELLASDQRMLLARAWALSELDLHDEAVDAIVRAAMADDSNGAPLPDGLSSTESSLLMLRATYPRGDVGAALTAARNAVELENAGAPWRPAACWVLGLQLYRSDRLQEANRWLREAAARAPGTGHQLSGCRALAMLSLIAGREGRPQEQRWLAERAQDLAQDWSGADQVGEALCALAASLAARGSYPEALPLFDRAAEVVGRRGEDLMTAEVLLQFAEAAVRAGDRARAQLLVTGAADLLGACRDPAALGRRADALASSLRGGSARSGQNGEKLSHRERVVLRLLAGDLPEREIGRELYLSFNTIHSHTKAIYRKLGVSSRKDALGRARVLGIL
jgi:LuxR family maltose regulon positive regulatory protein